MLRLVGLAKTFRTPNGRVAVALNDVTIEVGVNEFVMLMGPNGAGKSTLFGAITGDVRLDSGSVTVLGTDITFMPRYRRAHLVTRVHQSREAWLPRALTAAEVLALANEEKTPYDRGNADASEVPEAPFGRMHAYGTEQVWYLSGGEHQLLSLAVAACLVRRTRPAGHVVLLDEHVSQLDPLEKERVMLATLELARLPGVTTMMATHDCEVAARFGTRQIIMRSGRIVHDTAGGALLKEEALNAVIRGERNAAEVVNA